MAVFERIASFARIELQRKHIPEQFANRAQMAGQLFYSVVMTSDQPPQLAAFDERYRHGRPNAHVSQIFEVDG